MTSSRALVALALVSPWMPAFGQSVRVSGATSLRYVELRPFIRDSVAAALTSGEALLRQLPDGRVVRCIPGEAFCRDVRPGPVASTVPVMHDLEVSAWGFGEGLRLFAQARARTALGGNRALWPRADDAFDLLSLYAEIRRERLRVRAGRQWKVSGLGFYNFDGVSAEVRPVPAATIEAYGGRSLQRGLNEARTGPALESIESLSLTDAGLIAGLQARYRPSARLALGGLYQVDFRGDRRGLYSELAAADGVFRMGGASAEGSLEMDVAGRAVNQARLLVRSPPLGRTALFVEARRYRPYFELWTIWGAFSPVGFDEARGGVTWSDPRGRLIVRGEGSYRSYDDPQAGLASDTFRQDGWGLGTTVTWSPEVAWRVDAAYRVETGFGAARRDGQAGLRRDFGRGFVAVQGLAFQRLYEFRLDEGTLVGLGVEAALQLNDRARVSGSAAGYRHLGASGAAVDWTQKRASLRLEWVVGREPDARARPGGAR
jgi:hypothetical protein